MNNNIEEQLNNIMSTIFEIPIEEINDESTPDAIESWDSLKHINLVVALEEEFDTEFSSDEILKMTNYSLIKSILIKKMKNIQN